MCDFKPGDEVVCISADRVNGTRCALVEGDVYVVQDVLAPVGGVSLFTGGIAGLGVLLVGVRSVTRRGTFDARRFRKVIRRNDSLSIEAFLTIKPGQFEEPKRAPAKKRERVQ